mmetsp:Transcript_56797/g.161227  ORF Transcript_56797/g.161227 Transcript_56797/m.161227 type:complete len:91 (-) Transcript_56797:575-847(-)
MDGRQLIEVSFWLIDIGYACYRVIQSGPSGPGYEVEISVWPCGPRDYVRCSCQSRARYQRGVLDGLLVSLNASRRFQTDLGWSGRRHRRE